MKAFSVHSQASISAPRKYKSELARGLAKISSLGQLIWGSMGYECSLGDQLCAASIF